MVKSEWDIYEDTHTISVAELVGGKLLRDLQPLVTCPECEGYGVIAPRNAYPTCHGTGKVKDPSVGPEEVARRVLVALHDQEHTGALESGLSIPEQEAP